MRNTFTFKCSPQARKRAWERLQAEQRASAIDRIGRLKARDEKEPGFIWGEMLADARAAYVEKYGPLPTA